MDNGNEKENLNLSAEPAEAEKEKDEAAKTLGKFSSVEALMDAYLSLEAEFTRRSQRLKELEDKNKAHPRESADAPSAGRVIDGEELLKAALNDEEVKEKIIGDYLKTVSANKSVPLLTGGVSAAAPRVTPKTVKEAGELAKRFLK